MLLFPNALCCSLYERNCVCTVTKIFTKFLPANNFCQLLRVTRKRSCTSAGNAQAQLHFRDDQQRAFGISNISNFTIFKDKHYNKPDLHFWIEIDDKHIKKVEVTNFLGIFIGKNLSWKAHTTKIGFLNIMVSSEKSTRS